MILLGITGGIASGKSVTSNILKEKQNAYIFNADEEAKKLLFTEEISNLVLETFPELETITSELLAKIAFKDKSSQDKLNRIIHPAVGKEALKRIEEINELGQHSIFVIDAPLIIEGSSYKNYKEKGILIILITAPEDIRMERALSRGNLSPDTIQDRMNLQWSDDKKKEYADHVIVNDSSIDSLETKVENLINEITNKNN
ncbi:MAG: dephospho-CoA kinase [Candidatus Neomarinimicrobiota bacterium]|nr:dephospho-CoA kinase [Candidatus Neomarinimicrobiota bacterium]